MKVRSVYQVVEQAANDLGGTSLFFLDIFSNREKAKNCAQFLNKESLEDGSNSHHYVRIATFYDEQDDE